MKYLGNSSKGYPKGGITMGTNFYIRGFRHSEEPDTHIGKRSASGLYCWDCNVTLCKAGTEGIHEGRSEWYPKCPKCGKERIKELLEESTAGRELGFNKAIPGRKTGVATCSSFTWGTDPDQVLPNLGKPHICPTCSKAFDYPDADKVVEDEYGTLYSLPEFQQVLAECPIRYHNMIGKVFS